MIAAGVPGAPISSRSVQGSPSRPARVGIAGTFDVDNFGDVLFPHVARNELERRLPGVEIRSFSPLGRASAWDRGATSEALGPWSEERLDELRDSLDCLLIGGGDIIHTRFERIADCYGIGEDEIRALQLDRFFIDGLGTEREAARPVVWNGVGVPFDLSPEEEARVRKALDGRPYVAVRDRGSAARLEAVGAGGVEVVPDTAILVPRLVGAEVRGKRLRQLRAMGWWPEDGRILLIQGNAALEPFLDGLADGVRRILEARPDLTPVTISLGPCHGDDRFAAALAQRLGRPVPHVPGEGSLEDMVAAIAAATGFVGSSLHGNITAFAHDVPGVILDMNQHAKHRGFAEMTGDLGMLVSDPAELAEAFLAQVRRDRTGDIERLQMRADDHFDRIARVVEAAVAPDAEPARGSSEERLVELERELETLRRAYEARSRRLASDAAAYADQIAAQRIPMRKAEEFLRSRTYRYVSWLRAVYLGVRRPFGRR